MKDIVSISKTNIVEEVFNQLENMIRSGKWKPGDKLPSENELSKQFDVSRNTLRSALQKLKGMGVIVTHQGQGTFVSDSAVDNVLNSILPPLMLSNEEVLELAQFRKTVEMGSVYHAAINRDEKQLQKIKGALDHMRNSLDDYVEHAKADYQFHVAVAEASGNRYFLRMYKILEDVIYEHFLKMSHDLGTEISISGHEMIYKAIADKDPEMAQLLTSRNIGMSLHMLKERIE